MVIIIVWALQPGHTLRHTFDQWPDPYPVTSDPLSTLIRSHIYTDPLSSALWNMHSPVNVSTGSSSRGHSTEMLTHAEHVRWPVVRCHSCATVWTCWSHSSSVVFTFTTLVVWRESQLSITMALLLFFFILWPWPLILKMNNNVAVAKWYLSIEFGRNICSRFVWTKSTNRNTDTHNTADSTAYTHASWASSSHTACSLLVRQDTRQ